MNRKRGVRNIYRQTEQNRISYRNIKLIAFIRGLCQKSNVNTTGSDARGLACLPTIAGWLTKKENGQSPVHISKKTIGMEKDLSNIFMIHLFQEH